MGQDKKTGGCIATEKKEDVNMIEVIPNETPEKPEITDELVMSAIKVIMDYCQERDCEKCDIVDVCDYHFCGKPQWWDI